ncbi:hypothetical protein THITH_13065 [Thioalkalivibrio paradoxus ARh 1]|uniref:Uncharacterized protein n=1 Tax=Thioalkalivibrio paradoxus ARh 1 TaxID=713585 RepID=W0DTP3_9GAMM|nr:hypothetical protein THITH_13065 [Thioalkalivibrio paradoxus ARh 1]
MERGIPMQEPPADRVARRNAGASGDGTGWRTFPMAHWSRPRESGRDA